MYLGCWIRGSINTFRLRLIMEEEEGAQNGEFNQMQLVVSSNFGFEAQIQTFPNSELLSSFKHILAQKNTSTI